MSDHVRLTAVIPRNMLDIFLEKKRLDALDTMPTLHPRVKDAIRKIVHNYTGYSNEPVACISRYNGVSGEIKNIGVNVRQVLKTSPGTTMWELRMPSDMAVSIKFNELLEISSSMTAADEEIELEMLEEQLTDCIIEGYLEDDDVVSFIPFIDFSRCEFYAKIDSSWGFDPLVVPGVEQVKLVDMNIF